MKNILVWLRNDLRLHDNRPLHEAMQKAEKVWVAYCIDTRLFAKNQLDIPKTGVLGLNFYLKAF